MISAVVFDFDGVLADSEPLHLRVYQQLLAPNGINLTPQLYCERYLGLDDEGVFRQVTADYQLLLGDEEIDLLIREKADRFERLVTASNVPSHIGSRRLSARRTVPGRRAAARRAISNALSTPATRSPGRPAASRRVTIPVPQPTSSSLRVPSGISPSTASAAAAARGSPPRRTSYRSASCS